MCIRRKRELMKKLLILSFLSFLLNGIVSSNYWPHTWRNHTTTVRLLIIGDSVDRNSVLDWCANNDGNLCQPYRFCGPGAGFKFEGFSKLFPIKRFSTDIVFYKRFVIAAILYVRQPFHLLVTSGLQGIYPSASFSLHLVTLKILYECVFLREKTQWFRFFSTPMESEHCRIVPTKGAPIIVTKFSLTWMNYGFRMLPYPTSYNFRCYQKLQN